MISPGRRIEIKEEGVSQGFAQSVNFTGAGATASLSGVAATVNIPGVGDLTPNNMTPASSQTITGGRSMYVSDFFEITTGLFVECGSGAVLEIG